jgi:hypothetical protein
MTPICAIIVGPPLSATQHQRLDGCAPLRRVVLGHRQLRDAGRRVAQGAELSAISGSGIGSSNGRDQALAAITAASPFRQCQLGSLRANPGRRHLDYRPGKAPGSAAAACMRAIPRPLRVPSQIPAGIGASSAKFHQRPTSKAHKPEPDQHKKYRRCRDNEPTFYDVHDPPLTQVLPEGNPAPLIRWPSVQKGTIED